MHFAFVTSHKLFFLCINTSDLSYFQRFISKRKLVKTLLHAQLKQINLDELKHCNSDRGIDLQLLGPVFLCLYSIYLVVILPFFITCFALFFSLWICNILIPCYKIRLLLVASSVIVIFYVTFLIRYAVISKY